MNSLRNTRSEKCAEPFRRLAQLVSLIPVALLCYCGNADTGVPSGGDGVPIGAASGPTAPPPESATPQRPWDDKRGDGQADANAPPSPKMDAVGESDAVSCDDLLTRYRELMDTVSVCSAQSGCRVATIPAADDIPFCAGGLVAKDADESGIAKLMDQWKALGCSMQGVCPLPPKDAIPMCIDGRCAAISPCEMCPKDLDPVCTASGMNAINKCHAEKCLYSSVGGQGVCPDTPACLEKGGTCRETLPGTPGTTPLCADGEKFGNDFMRPVCADGNFLTTCCLPWDQPCPYLATTMNLSRDPFTCGRSSYGSGNTCLHPQGEVTSCQAAWTHFLPGGDADPQAAVRVTVRPGGGVTLEGTHSGTGRTFTCSGQIWWDPLDGASDWSCQACLGDDCTTCTIEQSASCAL